MHNDTAIPFESILKTRRGSKRRAQDQVPVAAHAVIVSYASDRAQALLSVAHEEPGEG